jgi:hypothetical protein
MAVITPPPHRFRELLPELAAWRDQLRENGCQPHSMTGPVFRNF